MVFILTILFPALLLMSTFRREPLARNGRVLTCKRCGYSLEGLAELVPCPECGVPAPGDWPAEWRYVFRPRHPRFLAVCTLVFVAACFGLEWLSRTMVAAWYVLDGYTWEVGRNAAPLRTDGVGLPLLLAVAVLPVCAEAEEQRTAGKLAAQLLLTGLVAAWLLGLKR